MFKETIFTNLFSPLSYEYHKPCKAVNKGCVLVLKWYRVISLPLCWGSKLFG